MRTCNKLTPNHIKPSASKQNTSNSQGNITCEPAHILFRPRINCAHTISVTCETAHILFRPQINCAHKVVIVRDTPSPLPSRIRYQKCYFHTHFHSFSNVAQIQNSCDNVTSFTVIPCTHKIVHFIPVHSFHHLAVLHLLHTQAMDFVASSVCSAALR